MRSDSNNRLTGKLSGTGPSSIGAALYLFSSGTRRTSRSHSLATWAERERRGYRAGYNYKMRATEIGTGIALVCLAILSALILAIFLFLGAIPSPLFTLLYSMKAASSCLHLHVLRRRGVAQQRRFFSPLRRPYPPSKIHLRQMEFSSRIDIICFLLPI